MKNDFLRPFDPDKRGLDIFRSTQDNGREGIKHIVRPDLKVNGVRSVNMTSDNRFLIITYEKDLPRIRILDLEKLEFLQNDFSGHTDSVRMTRITNDNKTFYTASWDGSSRRYEIESGKCDLILSGFGRSPSCFLEPDQKLLFTASYDADYFLGSNNNGRCWDLSSRKAICSYEHTGQRKSPESIDIVYEHGKVYTGSDDGYLIQWNMNGSERLITYFSINGSVRKLALSRTFIAASCSDGQVRVYFKQTGTCYKKFNHYSQDIREVRISGDEKRLWSATDDGTVTCFNLETGGLIYSRKVHPLWIWSLCLSRDERMLVTGSGDGTVAFLTAGTGQVIARLYNLPSGNDFLITCPEDKTFPSGFFYTTNTDLIEVKREEREDGNQEITGIDENVRKDYLSRLNLKNLMITRLKNEKHYDSLTNNYLQTKQLMAQFKKQEMPYMLKC